MGAKKPKPAEVPPFLLSPPKLTGVEATLSHALPSGVSMMIALFRRLLLLIPRVGRQKLVGVALPPSGVGAFINGASQSMLPCDIERLWEATMGVTSAKDIDVGVQDIG